MPEPFTYYLRVRYSECDAQGVVFNARYGEYYDVAASEYSRAVFGTLDPGIAIDWRLVRQTTEWKSPGRFDDVLAITVRTTAVGNTSFTLAMSASRWPDGTLVSTSETVYVVVDASAGTKRAIETHERQKLIAGAPGVVTDHAGAIERPRRAP